MMVPSEEHNLLVVRDNGAVVWAKISVIIAGDATTPRWHFFFFFSTVGLSVDDVILMGFIQDCLFVFYLSVNIQQVHIWS